MVIGLTRIQSIISYLPDESYFSDWMKASDALKMFEDMYADFDGAKAVC